MRRWLLLAVLGLLAGCAAKEETPLEDAVSALAGPSAEELARTPGTLQGVVHTPALAPVANATLAIAREGRVAATDASGLFRFEALPAGDHVVTVTAAGFETRSVSVAVRNGTISEVEIALTPSGPTDPYAQTREMAGFLSCSARVATPAGEQTRDCASADPNHRDILEFEVGEKASEVVVELVWDAEASPASSPWTLFVETAGFGALDLDLGNVSGLGHLTISVPGAILEKYYPEGGLMRARVEVTPPTMPPAAFAAQTRFTVYVTTFYNAPAPAGFSALSGQP